VVEAQPTAESETLDAKSNPPEQTAGSERAEALDTRPTTGQPSSDDHGSQAGSSSEWTDYRNESNFTRALRLRPVLSLGLLAMLIAIHFGFELLDLTLRAAGFETGPSIIHGAKINALVMGGAWWRLVSATLLHGGLLHLAFNVYAIFILAPILERLYGARRFLLIYMLSALGGSLASLYFNEGVSVGASGAIFGLLGALLVFGFKFRELLHRSCVPLLGSSSCRGW